MGYTTEFYGEIKVFPALSEKEQAFFKNFSQTRRVVREHANQGKYFLSDGTDNFGQNTKNIIENNKPPEGQPGLWCHWVSNKNGNIEWSGAEKFYSAEEWVVYFVEHFFKKDSFMKINEPETYAKYGFQEHNLNGVIYAKGEEPGDLWKIIVRDNDVFFAQGEVKKEVILSNQKVPVHQGMSKDEIYELFYDIWYDFTDIKDDMAVWGDEKRVIYNAPASDLMDSLLPNNAPKRLMIK